MIIGIAGYGYSGASAYIDILKEFYGMQALPGNNEFPIFQQTDGVFDLEHALVDEPRRLNISNAICRFIRNTQDPCYNKLNRLTNGNYARLSREYIDSLTDVSWRGKSVFDPCDTRNKLENAALIVPNILIRKVIRVFNKNAIWPYPKNRYFTMVTRERFITETQKYVRNILTALGFDYENDIILEQVFNTIDPLKGTEFFEADVISLVVDRDPRDIFILTNVLHPEVASFMPIGKSVEDFVYYYKALHAFNYAKNDGRVLYLRFEDLFYKYDEMISLLEKKLNKKIVSKGKYFQPARSANNIHMYKNFPEYEHEFKYIEENCKQYLYDFT